MINILKFEGGDFGRGLEIIGKREFLEQKRLAVIQISTNVLSAD